MTQVSGGGAGLEWAGRAAFINTHRLTLLTVLVYIQL